VKVIALAAGFATRLFPLTRDRAKPLLEVGGRAVLSRLLDRVLEVPEITEVVVVANHRFHGQFTAWREGYRASVPIRLIDDGTTCDEDKLGAIADLELAVRSLGPEAAGEDLLVVAGDNLLDFDLRPHAASFARDRRPLLLLRELEGPLPPARYNEVRVDDRGRVIDFREKPADPRVPLVAICLYFLPSAAGEWLREYLAQGGNPDAPGYFIEWLVGRTPVRAERFAGGWFDIGNLETLEAARAAFGG